MSLYSRLFRYQAREGWNPLEDFLTEALADLLEKSCRYEREQMNDFVERVLLGGPITDPPTKDAIMKRIRNSGLLKWKTQDIAAGKFGRPDIVLHDSHGPILVLENKINARFAMMKPGGGTEGREEVESEEEWIAQLPRYGEWLSENPGPSALVLLTHWTEPPRGFVEDGIDPRKVFKVPLRGRCRWHDVHAWLLSFPEAQEGGGLSLLASDLASFLEGRGMSAQITASDLNAARLIAGGSLRRLLTLMDVFREEARKIAPRGIFENKNRDFYGESVKPWVLWDWFWVEEDMKGRFIAWGVRFPGDFQDHEDRQRYPLLNVRQPEVEEFFVCIDTADRKMRSIPISSEVKLRYEASGDDEGGWEFSDSFCLKIKPVHRVFEKKDPRGTLISWYKQAVGEAMGLLENPS